jgi:predicted  nucleic acid-binding Zn-ribbon protein
MEKDLDQKRLELGVIKHVDDAKCGKCGQASLYVYPDAYQKCLECGHAFTTDAAPAKDTTQRSLLAEKDSEVRKPDPIEPKLREAPAKEELQKPPEKKRKGFLKW